MYGILGLVGIVLIIIAIVIINNASKRLPKPNVTVRERKLILALAIPGLLLVTVAIAFGPTF
jgi:hypothetical protein